MTWRTWSREALRLSRTVMTACCMSGSAQFQKGRTCWPSGSSSTPSMKVGLFTAGTPSEGIGRDQGAPGSGLRHDLDRVGAEGVGEERLVLERRGVGVDEEVDARVRAQARQSDRAPS